MGTFCGRCVLLIILAEAVHAVWLLEQPSGSTDVLPLHPRLNWLMNEILYAPGLYIILCSIP